MAGLSARLTAGLLVCSGVLAVAACQATAVPSPYTPSPEPSRAAAASVVPSVAASTPASVAPTRTVSPAVAKPATTAPARASKPSASSSLGPLRLSYRGITKLVVVKSVLNDTPAGRAAINAVALYKSSLATATADRTIEPARRIAGAACKDCQDNLARLSFYIQQQKRLVLPDGSMARWSTVAIFIRSIDKAGLAAVEFDGAEPTLELRNLSGKIIGREGSMEVSELEMVQVSGSVATIVRSDAR